uniref:Glutamate rich 4 n=1 Tax=Equus asinus asinus TaxID=83772 RepID=A0A8C4LCQ4_EQUAS
MLDLASFCSWLPPLRDYGAKAGETAAPGAEPTFPGLERILLAGRAGQTLMTLVVDAEGDMESLLCIWEELMRLVDALLLGQLCSLGLEMGALREELVAFLEEEEEKESIEEEEEGKEPERKKEEGHLGASRPAHCHRLPDFEMTI